MFERHQGGERAVLVNVSVGRGTAHRQEERQEFVDLVGSTGAVVARLVTAVRETPDPRFFVGAGKAEEVGEAIAETGASLAIFSHPLTPSQVRNLERLLKCRVIDRTELILDIFARRARSHEGKLQVELAQLGYLSTRLVRGWSHLERQKGGIGLRGPGETQLETDRRLLADRIRQINKRLSRVNSQREQSRRSRKRADVPTIALVGYTNAGKSTLFNALTQAQVYAEDQLFATLDPTLRRLDLPGGGHVVLADTVGFIRDLPHELVAAFRATLLETREADLLLHVVDAGSEERHVHILQVDRVLEEIGAAAVPRVLVHNKLDLRGGIAQVRRGEDGSAAEVSVSARTGEGLDMLLAAVQERCATNRVRIRLRIPVSEGRARAYLFRLGAVRAEAVDAGGAWLLDLELPRRELDELCAIDGVTVLDDPDPGPVDASVAVDRGPEMHRIAMS